MLIYIERLLVDTWTYIFTSSMVLKRGGIFSQPKSSKSSMCTSSLLGMPGYVVINDVILLSFGESDEIQVGRSGDDGEFMNESFFIKRAFDVTIEHTTHAPKNKQRITTFDRLG